MLRSFQQIIFQKAFEFMQDAFMFPSFHTTVRLILDTRAETTNKNLLQANVLPLSNIYSELIELET